MNPTLPGLESVPSDGLVLDVGGGAAHDPRADWVIDLEPWERRNWFYTERGERPDFHDRIPAGQWVQRDICDPEPWPFSDGQFAFAVCSQTLEDVRDPVLVCREMMRVARAGWIATPAAVTELTRGVESPHWCGWHHHRWLVEVHDGALTFLAKPHHIHSPLWPSVRSPRRLRRGALDHLSYTWDGPFVASEEIIIEVADIDRRLEGIIRAAASADPVGAATLRLRGIAWSSYLGARRAAGVVAALPRRR